MNDIPYLAISNDELGAQAETHVTCPTCGQEHPIEYGTSKKLLPDGTWSKPAPSKMLGVYRCGEKTYLATLNGRRLK